MRAATGKTLAASAAAVTLMVFTPGAAQARSVTYWQDYGYGLNAYENGAAADWVAGANWKWNSSTFRVCAGRANATVSVWNDKGVGFVLRDTPGGGNCPERRIYNEKIVKLQLNVGTGYSFGVKAIPLSGSVNLQ